MAQRKQSQKKSQVNIYLIKEHKDFLILKETENNHRKRQI